MSGFCFDDLGVEQQIKHFGNDCNVMAEILITQYEEFISNGSITHITTNLSATEIEKAYGKVKTQADVYLVMFGSNTTDKRA